MQELINRVPQSGVGREATQPAAWEGDLADLDMEYTSTGRSSSMEAERQRAVSDDALHQRRLSSMGVSSSSSSRPDARATGASSHRAPHGAGGSAAWQRRGAAGGQRETPPHNPGRSSSSSSPPGLLDARALTRLITHCSRTPDLHRLWGEHRHAFNHFHVAAMISCLAKV